MHPLERYFDHAASTPVDPAVLEAMLPFLQEEAGNAHLVVYSRAEAEFERLLQAALGSDYWMGLSDTAAEGAFTSVTGETVSLTVPPWGAGEPTGGRSENCVQFAGDHLNDLACESQHAALCECELPVTCPPSGEAPAYERLPGPLTFEQALAQCAQRGKRLVQLDSDVEQVRLALDFGAYGFWVDATDTAKEGDWLATTGCRPSLRWAAGTLSDGTEPDGGIVENCAALMFGSLIDYRCDFTLDALCEAP